jgi:vancomycin permeability regulator SanA
MKKSLKIIISSIILWFIIHHIITLFIGFHDTLTPSDCGVILGNKVYPDGTPSKRLQARLDKGIELFNKQLFKRIIVSGGIDKEGTNEASAMKKYLIKNGIPENAIIEDSLGKNSYMTAVFTKRYLDQNKLKSATAISQYHHITRLKLIFSKVGINPVYSAHASFFEWRDFYSIFREFAGFYKYYFVY